MERTFIDAHGSYCNGGNPPTFTLYRVKDAEGGTEVVKKDATRQEYQEWMGHDQGSSRTS